MYNVNHSVKCISSNASKDTVNQLNADLYHCLRRRDTQRIDLSAKAHHD